VEKELCWVYRQKVGQESQREENCRKQVMAYKYGVVLVGGGCVGCSRINLEVASSCLMTGMDKPLRSMCFSGSSSSELSRREERRSKRERGREGQGQGQGQRQRQRERQRERKRSSNLSDCDQLV
jgi:hypothetical protein